MKLQNEYIKQAQEYYTGLVIGEIYPYSSILFACLYEKFGIQTKDDIIILNAVSSQLYSDYVYLNTKIYTTSISGIERNINSLIISCDNEDDRYNTGDYDFINIKEKINEQSKSLSSYHNHYKRIYIASEIIKKRRLSLNIENAPFTLCNHEKWSENIIEEFIKINNYQAVVKFCISYMYYTEKDVVKKHFQVLPLRFYYLMIKSILKAEYLYVENYKTILQTPDNDISMDAFSVLPDIVTYGIDPIIEIINKCDNQYCSLIVEGNKEFEENIHLATYVENKFCRPKYKNEQVSIDTGQWIPIVDIIKLAYEVSYIDIAYISSSSNILLLMSLIKGLADFDEYYKKGNLEFIGSIDNNLWKKIESVNQVLRIKSAILLNQIKDHRQPKNDFLMIPRLKYSISDKTINRALDEVAGIHKEINNPFIEYYKKKKTKYNYVEDIDCLFKNEGIIPLNDEYISKLFDNYNKYAKKGIGLYLKHIPLYTKIKDAELQNTEDVKKNLDELKSYFESSDNLVLDIPPSLYVEIIKYLYSITRKYIEQGDIFALKPLNLLEEIVSLLRQATLSYKNGYTTPYRYRPLLEYSFYKYDSGKLSLYYGDELQDFIKSKNNDDNVFFISLLSPINPINFVYLENFFYCYNRFLHQLHHEMDKMLLKKKERDITYDMTQKMNDERKNTIQILGVFGSFIAFVSSAAGMIQSVKCIVDFVLFCVTFVFSLLFFVWCLNNLLFSNIEHFKTKYKINIMKGIPLLMLFIIVTICLFYKFKQEKFEDNLMNNPVEQTSSMHVEPNNYSNLEIIESSLNKLLDPVISSKIQEQSIKENKKLSITKDSVFKDTLKNKINNNK